MSAEGLMKDCKYCRESINAAATVCPHCRRNQPGRFRALRRGLLWTAATLIVLFVAMAMIGSRLNFHGKNHDLCAAMKIYNAPLTRDEADALVDQISKENKVAHARAQRVAVMLVQSNIPPKYWARAAKFGAKLVELKNRGIIPKNARCRPTPA